MTIPACLPLLVSRRVPTARRSSAAIRARWGNDSGFSAAAPSAVLQDAEWDEAASTLYRLLLRQYDRPTTQSLIEDLACPAGVRLLTALLSLAEESVESLAQFAKSVARRVLAIRPRRVGAPRGTTPTFFALVGDGYRRLEKPAHAEVAFDLAFFNLGDHADALTYARVEDFYARLERERGALGPALEGFTCALGAYEAAGALYAAFDTAVRIVSTLCEAGHPERAEGFCARAFSLESRPMPGAFLVREAAYLAARGRDAAVGLIERIACEGRIGLVSPLERRDLGLLRLEQQGKRFLHLGPGSAARDHARATSRSFALWCRAQLLLDTPEGFGLRTIAHLRMGGMGIWPDDLSAALIYFVPSTSAPGRSA